MSAEQISRRHSTAGATHSEAQAEFDLDAILQNWRFIAAIAWEGYLSHGRGIVKITVSGERADVAYRGGAFRAHEVGCVDSYDPQEQLVLVVCHQSHETLYLLAGYPSPPRCFANASARMMQATVH